MCAFQDTCVGFLLGGIGEINKNRQPNFFVVDKSKESNAQLILNACSRPKIVSS